MKQYRLITIISFLSIPIMYVMALSVSGYQKPTYETPHESELNITSENQNRYHFDGQEQSLRQLETSYMRPHEKNQMLEDETGRDVRPDRNFSTSSVGDDPSDPDTPDNSLLVDFSSPSSIVFTQNAQNAFVTNTSGNSVSGCDVDVYGNFSNCQENKVGDATKFQAFFSPAGIVLTNDGKHVYVTNRDNDKNSIAYCDLSGGGTINVCKVFTPKTSQGGLKPPSTANTVKPVHPPTKNTLMALNAPVGLAISPDNTKLFVANGGDEETPAYVTACSLGKDGSITSCNDAGVKKGLLLYSGGLTLATSKDKTFAFIANFGNSRVTSCTVNLQIGKFLNCVNSAKGAPIFNPASVAVNMDKKIAYVANFGKNMVSLCKVNADNGLLSGCQDSKGTGFSSPFGITLNKKKTLAFVANGEEGTISRCMIGPKDQKLYGCRNVHPALVMQQDNIPVSRVNIKSGSVENLTLRNFGDEVNQLLINIPADKKHLFTGSTCPLSRPENFAKGASCTLHYNVPKDEKRSFFNISIMAQSSKIPWIVLPVSISDVYVEQNGKPANRNHLVLYRGELHGTFSFISPSGIKNFKLKFSSPDVLKYMKGDCLNSSELKPGAHCTVDYDIKDESQAGRYTINLNSGSQTIFSIPLTLSLSNSINIKNPFVGVPNYNRKDINIKNLLNRPVTNVKIKLPTKTYFKLVKNTCSGKSSLNPGDSCIISLFGQYKPTATEIKNKTPPKGDEIQIYSDQFESVVLTLVPLPIPTTTCTAVNSGGYKVNMEYSQVQPDGYTYKHVRRGYLAIGQSHTLHGAPMFNDYDDLPKGLYHGVRFFVRGQPLSHMYRHREYIVKPYRVYTCTGSTWSWKCD